VGCDKKYGGRQAGCVWGGFLREKIALSPDKSLTTLDWVAARNNKPQRDMMKEEGEKDAVEEGEDKVEEGEDKVI